MTYDDVTADEFAALPGLDDWRYALRSIHATFLADSFPAATALAASIGEAAEDAGHHPDIDVRYPGLVHVALTTHATGGLTTHDTALAATISSLAAEAGVASDPHRAQAVEFAIDTLDADRIRPFWKAVLGYEVLGGSLVDPLRIGPPLWFQQMDRARTERSRFHVDVSVPHDVAGERIDAALAAGGRMVTDRFARSWWVLADADGNEACICIWQDRG